MLRFNPPEEVGKPEDEEWVGHEQLQAMLGNYTSLKLVVLNACEGAEIAGAASVQRPRKRRAAVADSLAWRQRSSRQAYQRWRRCSIASAMM